MTADMDEMDIVDVLENVVDNDEQMPVPRVLSIDMDKIIQENYSPIEKNTPYFNLFYKYNFIGKLILYLNAMKQSIAPFRKDIAKAVVNYELSKTSFLSPPITLLPATLTRAAKDLCDLLKVEGSTKIHYEESHVTSEGRVDAKGYFCTATEYYRRLMVEVGLGDFIPNNYRVLKKKDTRQPIVPVNVEIDLSLLLNPPGEIDDETEKQILSLYTGCLPYRIQGPFKERNGRELTNYFRVLQSKLAPKLVEIDFCAQFNTHDETDDEERTLCSEKLKTLWGADARTLIVFARETVQKAAATKPRARKSNETPAPNDAGSQDLPELSPLIYIYRDFASLTSTNLGECEKSHEEALGFLLLPFFLKLTNFKSKNKWRPKLPDILLSFIVHSKAHGNLQEILIAVATEQVNRFDQENPYIIYCGHLHNLECCHVVIPGKTHDLKTAVEAVDFLFKFFLVTSWKWPPLCTQMDLNKLTRQFSCDLYANLDMSRSDVQFIIEKFSSYIHDVYNPFLLEIINKSLEGAVQKEVSCEIAKIFERHKFPFEHLSTEARRLQIYTNLGIFKEPEICSVGKIDVAKITGLILEMSQKDVCIARFPLADGLKRLFEIDGLFEATYERYNYLKANKYPMMDFTQGELWEKLSENFKDDEIVLPLFGYYDEVQTGHALGTHAAEGNLGTFYVQPATLPPNFSSKLDSIIVTDILLSKTRKEYGNKAVFSRLIQDANNLRRNGIVLNIKGKKIKVHFLMVIILGDSLGLNQIFEFVSSFCNTRFCRICYCGPDLVPVLVQEDTSLLRTVEKYEEDISQGKSLQDSGVHGVCAFNELDEFHVVPNSSADVMHDVFEGICHYVMAAILLYFVSVRGRFKIDYLNGRMHYMNFGFESSNIPPKINLDHVRKNNRFRMSSSEMLFLVRYFSILVGDLVLLDEKVRIPKDEKVWNLYLKLREIVDLLTSPFVTESRLARLEDVIREHHSLYLELFGYLKAKFHFLLHYIRIIRRTGPVIKTSSIRFEAFHQIIKKCIESSNCHKNILKTIGIRLQLRFMNLNSMKYEEVFKTCGREIQGVLANALFHDAQRKKELKSVTLNGITYSENSIIVVDFNENGKAFGLLKNVFEVDGRIVFRYLVLKPCGFDDHYFAHRVSIEENCYCTIFFEDLASHFTCLMFEIDNKKLIVARHIL